jgi:hypothetical protein
MFAHLRSKNAVLAKYQFLMMHLATKMRDNVRSHVSALTGLDPSKSEVADALAEIWLREFACTLNTLQQVNQVASRYHEHEFDNTDTYMQQDVQPAQLAPHEMTTEQRHASQLLLGVGRNYTEVNVALRSIAIELTARDVMDPNVANMRIVAQQFQDPSVAEDAFDRLQHVAKQVWSLVNMLAFSNLFRFADPRQPMCIPNQDDAIFIPFIPMKTVKPNQETELVAASASVATVATVATEDFDASRCQCNECGNQFDPETEEHRLIISTETPPFYLCHSCSGKQE